MQMVPFSLADSAGSQVSFPGSRASLVCIVKEDCPTCREVMPVLAALHGALADQLDLLVIGQTTAGNEVLEREFDLPFALLDDSSLKVSFATDIDTVPTLFHCDGEGATQHSLIGFVREEWEKTL